MAPKERRSFSIDKDLHEWVSDRAEFNASGAVNRYLRDRKNGYTHDDSFLLAEERRLERELSSRKDELEAAAERVDAVENELEQVRRLREQAADEDYSNEFHSAVSEVVALAENDDIRFSPQYDTAVEALRDPNSKPSGIVDNRLKDVDDVNDRDVFIDAVERELEQA